MIQKLFTKNFILLILGQIFSLFGNFILKLALSMYLLEITGSAAIFAIIVSITTIVTILFSPLGGIIADRVNRRNTMVALDTVTAISVLCATFFLYQKNDIIVISILLIALSILGAFETPTVQSCIPTMLKGDNITKGNAIVNQVASFSYLTAPMIGGILYTILSLKTVMYASVICFLITALLECFIKLDYQHLHHTENILSIVKQDFLSSIHYIFKQQYHISNMLLFIALFRFFVMSIILIGLPYIVCTILGFNAKYYGIAESALAIATILGSIISALIAEKLKIHKLSMLLYSIGIFIICAGAAFLFKINTIAIYSINIISFCGMQIAISIFSIFVVSLIQQITPNDFIGKVMSYTSAITLSVQPIGQILYGYLFDKFRSHIYVVLIPTGWIVCIMGLYGIKFFKKIEKEL